MNNEYTPDLITLLDDNNREHSFEILDIIEYDEKQFYALMPVYDDKVDILYSNGEYVILESAENNGEQLLLEVEDTELKERLSQVFEEHFDEMFYED